MKTFVTNAENYEVEDIERTINFINTYLWEMGFIAYLEATALIVKHNELNIQQAGFWDD